MKLKIYYLVKVEKALYGNVFVKNDVYDPA